MSFFPFPPLRLGFVLSIFLVGPVSIHRASHHDHPDANEPPEAYADLFESAEVFETFPDGSLPKPPSLSFRAAEHAVAPASGQPPGALTGRIVYTSAGHGWTRGSGGSWSLQRPLLLEMNEDYGNRDQMSLFAQYAFNAGATVVPLRPIGNQTNEVVIDNVDPQVIWQGTWNTSTQTKYYGKPGKVPYQWATLAPTETATATYVPEIPETGFYPVYTWVMAGADRTFQLYRIRHTGGESEVRVPHHMVGNGWVYLGTYYFDAGSDPERGAVVISNQQSSTEIGTVAIADAIRFGNGMSTDGSTYPKEEEASRYWVKNSLGVGQSSELYDRPGDDNSDNVGAPVRMAREMNREAASPLFKSIYIGFHTNATTGVPATATARGVLALHNGNHPGTSTPNQLRWAQIIGREVNDQMVELSPRLEVPWQNNGTVTLSRTDIAFGEINNHAIGGEFDATILESGFHDNIQDALILRDPKARKWIARASYRAVVRYMNEFDDGPLVFLPEPPGNAHAIIAGPGQALISWDISENLAGSGDPESYVIYRSTDGYGFGNPVFVSGGSTTSAILDIPTDAPVYFRIAARNAGGESFPSATVGVHDSSNPEAKRVLVVNGYHRFDRTINIRQTPLSRNYRAPGHDDNSGAIDRILPRAINSFDYVVQYGEGISAHGHAFDSCSTTAVNEGFVDLLDYDFVIWAAGQESTSDRLFTRNIRDRIIHFLQNGGGFFVSGSNVASMLDGRSGATQEERDFLRKHLHTGLASENSATYQTNTTENSFLQGLPGAAFDSGPGGIYPVRNPDRLSFASNYPEMALQYSDGVPAVVAYDGAAGGGRTVTMGFPFETILDASLRNSYMARILDFLDGPLQGTAPVITAQPETRFAITGANITLSVSATGIPRPSFQWQRNGVDIPGATGRELILDSVETGDSGEYRVIIHNAVGSTTSEIAELQVFSLLGEPRFARLSGDGDGTFEALLLGEPESWYLVETSTDLHQWAPLRVLPVTDAPVFFSDPESSQFSRRFYRAHPAPVAPLVKFSDYTIGEPVLFQAPSHPGPSTPFIETGSGIPNFVRITNNIPSGINANRVLHVSWSFRADRPNPWLRLTTYQAPHLPNPTIDFSGGLRLNIYVDRPVYLALTVRETNSTAPIGADGGDTGSLEWVGGRTDNSTSPPRGILVPANEWIAVDFFLPYEPVRSLAVGNGILESTSGKGVLDGLGIVPVDGSGIYNLFLGDIHTITLDP